MSNKKSKSAKSKPAQNANKSISLASRFIIIYLFAMFTLFPLFVAITVNSSFPFIHFDDGFIGIRHQKYYFFVVMTALAVIAEVLLIATGSFSAGDKKSLKGSLFENISFTDWAAMGLVLSCAISTVLSPYIELAFWGEATIGGYSTGRNNGLFLILVYIIAYFLITRLFRYSEFIFVALACSCAAVYLLTVLNGFYIDPLNMFEQFKSQENVYMEFFSTIGNKNMLSSFICVTLPVIFVMSILTQSQKFRVIYLISTGLGAMALIIGDSDSGMLGMSVFLAVFLVVFIRRPERLKRYFLALTVVLASAKLLRLFSLLMNDNYKKLGELPSFILFSNASYIALGAAAVITALLFLLDKKKPDIILPKALPIALAGVFALAVLGAAGTVIYFSAIDTETPLGDMENLLRFSPSWGTHRGIMWIRSFDIFGGADFIHKLFGYGPDTFYCLYEPYFSELQEFGNSSTDAAHNEYINYLVTIGIAGLAAYLAFVGGALVRGFKAAKKSPVALAFAAAVIAYAAQAVVNIAVPISTPLFIIFVSLCESVAAERSS